MSATSFKEPRVKVCLFGIVFVILLKSVVDYCELLFFLKMSDPEILKILIRIRDTGSTFRVEVPALLRHRFIDPDSVPARYYENGSTNKITLTEKALQVIQNTKVE